MTAWCSSYYYQSTLKYDNAEEIVNKISQIQAKANLVLKSKASWSRYHQFVAIFCVSEATSLPVNGSELLHLKLTGVGRSLKTAVRRFSRPTQYYLCWQEESCDWQQNLYPWLKAAELVAESFL